MHLFNHPTRSPAWNAIQGCVVMKVVGGSPAREGDNLFSSWLPINEASSWLKGWKMPPKKISANSPRWLWLYNNNIDLITSVSGCLPNHHTRIPVSLSLCSLAVFRYFTTVMSFSSSDEEKHKDGKMITSTFGFM